MNRINKSFRALIVLVCFVRYLLYCFFPSFYLYVSVGNFDPSVDKIIHKVEGESRRDGSISLLLLYRLLNDNFQYFSVVCS